jgi:tetratricopeptide (TPR) repeat protein
VGVIASLLAISVAATSPFEAARFFALRGPDGPGEAQQWLGTFAGLLVGLTAVFLFAFERYLNGPFVAAHSANQNRLAVQVPPDPVAHFRSQFWELRGALTKYKLEYEKLPAIKTRRLGDLANTARQRALKAFLDSHRIIYADIPNIGASRKATLLSYGIETALDVNSSAIEAIPGFGPTLASYLVALRNGVEGRFRFDATKHDDSADRRRIEQEETARELRLRSALSSGPAKLQAITNGASREMRIAVTRQAKIGVELAQTSADVGAMPSGKSLVTGAVIMTVAVAALQPALYGGLSPRRAASPAAVPVPSAPAPVVVPQPEVKTPTAQEHYDRAIVFVKQKQFAEAESELRQAVTIDDKHVGAWHELGYVLYKLGKLDESVAASQRAIEIDATSADRYRNLGMAYASQLKWDDAAGAFAKAAELEPKVAKHFVSLAIANRKVGDLSASRKAIETAVTLEPKLPDAHLELGRLCLKEEDLSCALEQLVTLRTLDPRRAEQLSAEIDKVLDPAESPTGVSPSNANSSPTPF